MECAKKEPLAKLGNIEHCEKQPSAIDLKIKDIICHLISYDFEVCNIVHCNFDDKGTRAILVDDRNGHLPSLRSKFEVYPIYVYPVDEINESDIDIVYGDAEDFLAISDPAKQQEARIEG